MTGNKSGFYFPALRSVTAICFRSFTWRWWWVARTDTANLSQMATSPARPPVRFAVASAKAAFRTFNRRGITGLVGVTEALQSEPNRGGSHRKLGAWDVSFWLSQPVGL